MYYSEPEAQLNNRQLYCPRGKVQGGSGSINAMIYMRGQPHDFDDWERAGNRGWGFRDVLPYFKRLESHPAGDTKYHGSKGKIRISSMKEGAHAICRTFVEGARQTGFPLTGDFNGEHYEGAGIYDLNARNGERSSSSFEYLHPALSRKNLRIERNVTVRRVLFDGKRAMGVQASRKGEALQFRAKREVIMSAGAVDSPKLMQLSGLGEHALLAKHGIPVVHELPAVGKNLQDHLCVSFYYRATVKTLNDELRPLFGKVKAALQYLTARKGPLSMSVNQSGGFFKGDTAEAEPNLQLYFNPLSYRIPKSSKAQL
ncbi:Choline dehydrogenase [Candidatus Burkholderia verschuerenii]|uniref:Choline dehydrogenase n=1 Tax=Candidatus Burkholderia verschuerenii TaxID=242163 RepID=A0A0L0MBA5_9BURK|nr:Choline dehydrogenase [Candidatus Burkholderia verschuerenii]